MERLKNYYRELTGNELSENQCEQFKAYYEMLVEKNKVMNLTAITEWDEVVLKHFMDSIALAGYFDFGCSGESKHVKIIDVGTGAGFPGIPLKIAFPWLDITLFDSLNKRILFLQDVINEIGLNEEGAICAIHGRAEEGARNAAMREKYDVVVSRAVASMAVLAEYCLPFVKQEGYFIPYKTGEVDEELNGAKKAIKVLGGKCERVEKLTLPGSDIGRSFVFIKKEGPTPKAYPRKAGTAVKQPIV